MNDIIKPRILISSCLMGEEVRYDGSHKKNPFIISALSRWSQLVPLCPEVEAGLGIPRPPIELVSEKESVLVVEVESRRDVTEKIRSAISRFAEQQPLGEIHGAILKSRSPSCGKDTTPLILADETVSNASGLWAEHLSRENIPIIDEEQFAQLQKRRLFLKEVLLRAGYHKTEVNQKIQEWPFRTLRR